MTDFQNLANQIKQALDRIASVRNDPNQIQQAVNDAKSQVDRMAQEVAKSQG